MLNSVSYKIDENPFVTVNVNSNLCSSFNYSVILANIEDGAHSLKVYVNATGVYRNTQGVWQAKLINGSSVAVFFTMDTEPPKISDLHWSFENKSNTGIELTFNIDQPASMISYSLDDEVNVAIAGNTTTSLPNGAHKLQVYAADYAGNIGTSETIYTKTEPFPTAIVAVSGTVVAVVAVGLLFYYKKRKH